MRFEQKWQQNRQEFLLFSLSNHHSTLFQIHQSLHLEISDSTVKAALKIQFQKLGH